MAKSSTIDGMSNLVSIPQNAQDLVLALVEHDALPSMRVLLAESVEIAAWRFDFAIIGESHYVRISHEGRLLMREILACLPLKAEDCKLYQPFSVLEPFAYQESAYQVAVGFESRLPVWTQKQDSLSYQFPVTHGKVPETRIQWQIHAGQLRWQTLHSYPEARRQRLVLSESAFRFD